MVDKTQNKYFFEGAEKNIKIFFSSDEIYHRTLRDIPKCDWEKLLKSVNCEILNEMKRGEVTSYVLSESSLFVYDNKLVLKTCGNTSLLSFLDPFLKYVKEKKIGISFDCICYTHKKFLQPSLQPKIYHKFESEVGYLDVLFNKRGISKDFGSFYFYISMFKEGSNLHVDDYELFELLMSDLSEEKMDMFYKKDLNSKEVTKASKIDSLIPFSDIDEHLFEPCGYSMNGINKDNKYWTIHITPEPSFSYVSFETNLVKKDEVNSTMLTSKVVDTFHPNSFILFSLNDKGMEVDNFSQDYSCVESFVQELVNIKLTVKRFIRIQN